MYVDIVTSNAFYLNKHFFFLFFFFLMAKNFALVIKSYLLEEIFVDDKGVNCTSLEIVHAKKHFTEIFFEALLDRDD